MEMTVVLNLVLKSKIRLFVKTQRAQEAFSFFLNTVGKLRKIRQINFTFNEKGELIFRESIYLLFHQWRS